MVGYDVSAFGIKVKSVSGNEQHCYCPYHSDGNASASFNMLKGVFYCFGCKTSKTALQLSKEVGVDFSAFETQLEFDLDLYNNLNPSEGIMVQSDPNQAHLDYICRRKINVDFLPPEISWVFSPFQGIGFKTPRGTQVRTIDEGAASRYMFFFDRKRPFIWPERPEPLSEPSIFVEGSFAALRMHTVLAAKGYDNIKVFSLMGSKCSPEVAAVAQRGSIFYYDNDEPGLRAMRATQGKGFVSKVTSRALDEVEDEALIKLYDKFLEHGNGFQV